MPSPREIRENAARIDQIATRRKTDLSRAAVLAIMKETEAEKRERRISDLAALIAAATDPDLMKRVAPLADDNERRRGRPSHYPDWVMFLYGQAIVIYKSALNVQVNLDHHVWPLVVSKVAEVYGTDFVADLPTIGPTVYHFNHWKRKAEKKGWVAPIRETHRDLAATQALDMGLFDPDLAFQLTEPTREVCVTLDGKVSSSPSKHKAGIEYVDKKTGDTKTRRYDPNTKLWPEAGTGPIPEGASEEEIKKLRADDKNHFEWGVKGTYCWARLVQSNTRLCLDVETMSPEDHDEGRAIVNIVDGLADRLPGLQTVVVDGILHHTHINPLMRRGLMVVNKPTQGAKNARSTVKIGERNEKSHHIETYTPDPDDPRACKHRLYGIGGAVYEAKADAAGKQTYTRLNQKVIRTKSGDNYNWYRVVDIDCHRCGGKKNHRIPLLARDEDGFLRSEYIRQMAPTDANFAQTYGFRPDAESANNGIEQAWHLNRMPAYGQHNQSLMMLFYAAQVNVEARYIHTNRLIEHGLLEPQDPAPTAA